ncbi:DUF3223 domain-containing protein [Acidovorax sp. CCYZU-2555]|uniref:DUF3223 domain-containing protein n=1 Tax=Acidovorax sp. CCYZU-2555 TaxID=2835042 RepID=UPI001BCE31F1|nr:DUF3223 domain-containing protein [Acidovorax sp. CCYZU-2555]MBS7777669.1 DUF3223 domain-containing protein [Acidovorax sp. CCYZU-2555]
MPELHAGGMLTDFIMKKIVPRGTPFALTNGSAWPNRTAAKKHFSVMLNLPQYSIGSTITDAKHHDDLLALVVAYDAVKQEWAGAKTGSGVDHFIKEKDDEPSRRHYGTSCFYVVRTDGTKVHFSTNDAIDDIALASV